MAADAGAALVDARLLERPQSYSGNSKEWNAVKFVSKSFVGVVAHPMLAAMIHAETLTRSQAVGFPRKTNNSHRVCRFCWHKSCPDHLCNS